MNFKTTICLFLSVIVALSASAQNEKKYTGAMKKNIAILDTAQSEPALQLLANNFERIALAEQNKWLPYYYASYALVRKTYVMADKSQIDNVLDKADRFISIADSLQPKNSEILTVRSFVASGRIMVNPMARGAQYGPLSGAMLDQAIQLDPSNPRPYLLKGTAAFYTPPQWGGGKDKAADLFETALERYAAFKPADELAPDWGKVLAETLLAQCKE